MCNSSTLRAQIEATLARRIPSALTPAPRMIQPVLATGIAAVDTVLEGGLPVGAITEIIGLPSSGRTSLAVSFLSRIMQAGKVCAWADVSNTFDPESAAAAGVDLHRLLWVRCGVSQETNPHRASNNNFRLPKECLAPPPIKKGLHGGGMGSHPRDEVKGVSSAVHSLWQPQTMAPRCAEPQPRVRMERKAIMPVTPQPFPTSERVAFAPKPWSRIDQALRATDLLLQAGGFAAIVLDFGDIAPEFALRVPLATWFRYRAAAERTQASVLLLTQHACAKSSAGLVLHLEPGDALRDERTLFSGVACTMNVTRQRSTPTPSQIVPLRNPPQRANTASWHNRTPWVAQR
jgi:recombination protein RecA